MVADGLEELGSIQGVELEGDFGRGARRRRHGVGHRALIAARGGLYFWR